MFNLNFSGQISCRLTLHAEGKVISRVLFQPVNASKTDNGQILKKLWFVKSHLGGQCDVLDILDILDILVYTL